MELAGVVVLAFVVILIVGVRYFGTKRKTADAQERNRQEQIERDHKEQENARHDALEKLARGFAGVNAGSESEARLLLALDSLHPTELDLRKVAYIVNKASHDRPERQAELRCLLESRIIAAIERETSKLVQKMAASSTSGAKC